MSRFNPLQFQKEAVEKLTAGFLKLWQQEDNQRALVFKSPTGSGKTYMVSHFIHGLNGLPDWDYNKAVIWITFSDTLAMQSKNKFREYFNTTLENNLLTVDDFKQGKLCKNDVLFVNWQKLVSKAAENRVLRRPEEDYFYKEEGYYFEDIIENTKKEGREIILVVDESHTHLSGLAQKSVVDVIDPKVILHVSATPTYIPNMDEIEEGKAGYVSVSRNEAVNEGLIKDKIVVQTDEDLHQFKNKDLDELLIDLAIGKKAELENEYSKLDKKINPLVLIQLPNDDSKLKDAGQKTKEELVLDYLRKKNIDVERKVALWFDGKQENMDFVTHNDSDVDFMLFKQAAGTGWDCPRAHVLVMYREINSPTFFTQTIGRILRMPEPIHKDDYKDSLLLRTGYLFTNYKRNEVSIPDQSSKNKPLLYISKKKEGSSDVENLYSDFVSRADYGDLGNAIRFQMSFLKSFDAFFGIEANEHMALTRPKIEAKGIDLNPKLINKLIVDAEFSDYDRLNLEFAKQGKDEEYEMSGNDVEKLFNFWCFRLLSEQTDVEAKVSNVSRSWSPLKSALRVWLKRNIDLDSNSFYRIFIHDIHKEQASIFRSAITKALKEYYPIKTEFLKSRKAELESREAPLFRISDEYGFTDDFSRLKEEEGASELSVIQPFYLRKNYAGRENELKFINYLEHQKDSLEWWFKNGNAGKEFYSLKYFNTSSREEALFYPDWILKFKDGRIGIFDTKSGFTARDTEGRAEGLAAKLKELNAKGGNYVGGLIVLENNKWYYFFNEEYNKSPEKELSFGYEYIPGKLNENWIELDEVFKKTKN
ncbi:type III restriction enzyme [Chryseobacterium defluvii]|uniref:Type III restriction enzyme n=1 Tax=Chryseobacterium defluvii TaxID=160396 RepID=A0A840KBQ3_9FLAO|nr:DEAD/DEAH box helicase family protein [Chryseobacterium defluvii]MBB4805905.1 type III restriction enzyme [Chryseobacterium defluvii]